MSEQCQWTGAYGVDRCPNPSDVVVTVKNGEHSQDVLYCDEHATAFVETLAQTRLKVATRPNGPLPGKRVEVSDG